MKCSCLIVEEKKTGPRLTGAGTTDDPYLIERQGFDAINEGSTPAQTIGVDGVKLKKGLTSIDFSGQEIDGDEGTIIWERPLENFTIKSASSRSYNPSVRFGRFTNNDIEFAGRRYANADFYTENPDAQPYGVIPETFDNPQTSVTCAKIDPYFFSGGLGNLVINAGTGFYNTIGFSNQVPAQTKDVTFLIRFNIDDMATSVFPGSIGLGDNAGMDVYLGMDAPTLGMRDQRLQLNKNANGPFWAPRAQRGSSCSYSFVVTKRILKYEQTYTYLLFNFYNLPPGRLLTVRNISIQTIGIS